MSLVVTIRCTFTNTGPDQFSVEFLGKTEGDLEGVPEAQAMGAELSHFLTGIGAAFIQQRGGGRERPILPPDQHLH